MYYWLANLVTLLHALMVAYVFLGAIAAVTGRLRRYPLFELLYYILLGALILSALFTGDCLMTLWEKALRNRDLPGSAYPESCIGHYLPWLPPFLLSTIGPILVIGGLLAFPYWRWRDRRKSEGVIE